MHALIAALPGVVILLQYKFARGLESARYAVRGLKWLGVLDSQLSSVDDAFFQPLSTRDRAMLPNLRAQLACNPSWRRQLDEMEDCGVKADIEALYSAHGFAGLHVLLTRAILARQYLD